MDAAPRAPLGPSWPLQAPSDVAIIVDFDNTLTDRDVGDLVTDRFGDARWRTMEDGHRRGEVTTRDLIAFMFGSLRATEAELRAYAREIGRLRPGAAAFLKAARAQGVDLVIASGGLDLYIHAILGELMDGVRLVCNRARFDGGRGVVDFPDGGHGCGECGNCKGEVVAAARTRGAKHVIAIGDGTSDRCLALTADVVIARDWLLTFARAEGRVTHPFEDFLDVARVVGKLVAGFDDAFADQRRQDALSHAP